MTYFEDDEHADMIDELRAQERARKMHQARLMYHPDCRDPDHPGCERCMEEENDDQS